MSEPRHIYAWTEWHGVPVVVAVSDRADAGPDAKRHTLTEGPEFEALMQSAREALETPAYKNAMLKGDALRDLLAYLGEQP